MLTLYVKAALVVGPIVWAFFYLYFHAKRNNTRRSLFLGMLYGAMLCAWIIGVTIDAVFPLLK